MSKISRVPAALHSEITEYASLLRALRARHVLDLSAHLSQLASRSSQLDEESESEPSLLDEDNGQALHAEGESKIPSNSASSTSPTTHRTAGEETQNSHDSRHTSQAPDTNQHAPSARKKQKLSKTDTWTRWPLLAGDVYQPELSLTDEVQFIASQVFKKRRLAARDDVEGSSSDMNDDSEEDELDDLAAHALTASTAEYLRSLLSACSVLVPRVEPSLRTRLAPLNWTSVLSAAAANGLASPEALERTGLRLEALYGDNSSPNRGSDSGQGSQATLPALRSSIERHVHATRAVQSARERLISLIEERQEHGDGDFLSFTGPRRRKRKKTRWQHKKEEINTEDALAKKEDLGGNNEEDKERQSSHSVIDGSDGEELASKDW